MEEAIAIPSECLSDLDYQETILKGVSRSFALTIPQLPGDLRPAVTNAYLLCRIVDTIEDENALSPGQKRFFFKQFVDVVSGNSSAHEFSSNLFPLLTHDTLLDERELVRNAYRVIRITHSLSEQQRAALTRCVRVMSDGMDRFQQGKTPHGLRDLPHLDNYCYHVAGVVGEMLTELFCAYSPEISMNRERLLALAASFGQGLQMTNILKDLWDDKSRGACWLPRDVFQKAGFDLKDLSVGKYMHGFGEGLAELIGIACLHLRDALRYTLMIPPHETGIRKFCLWALGMAILTLRKINSKRNYRSGREVKISRRSAKAVILVTNMALRSNYLLEKLFALTTSGLPVAKMR